jgi:RecA-family ATPase
MGLRPRQAGEDRRMTDPEYGFGGAGQKARDSNFSSAQGKSKQTANGRDPDHELPVIEWHDRQLSDGAKRLAVERQWIIPQWIPRQQTTGIYGAGGVNKTDFLIGMGMAKSRGLLFLEYKLEAGPVYGLFCEDTEEEIYRRGERIAKAWGFNSLADFPDFHFVSLVGFDDPEFVTFDSTVMRIEAALYVVDQKIVKIGAHLVMLDTLPHFFGGDEVRRREVSRFIRKLDGISIGRNCAVVFTAHPSARGARSGTLDSGSTGWEGGVRARLTLQDPGPEGLLDDPTTPKIASDRRILTRAKSNYARAGETIELVCRDGVFIVAGTAEAPGKPPPKRGAERDAACDAKFLDLLAKATVQGRPVTDSVHGRYAPKVFAIDPEGLGIFSAAEFTRAMERLFNAKRLRVESYGSPSKNLRRLTECPAGSAPEPAENAPENAVADDQQTATVSG